jgi:predicted CoA-binding protein
MQNDRLAQFYQSRSFAIIGMSRSRGNFAWAIHDSLIKAGKKVFPVHPESGYSRGIQFYDSIESLPLTPEAAILSLDLKKQSRILSELKASGIKKVWLQQGSFDDFILREAERAGLNPITGCALMYLPGASFIRRLHRFLYELFKKGPP